MRRKIKIICSGFEKASGVSASKMDTGVDFLNILDDDVSVKIFACLDDPSDLVRASSVSRSWRKFVITSGLCKQLCLRMFPQLHRVGGVTDPRSEVGCSKSVEWQNLETEHRAYAFFAYACTSFPERNCIFDAISASSTDNYPAETIRNTLIPGDRFQNRASYWSSKGQSNPAVPETLVYKMLGSICVITEFYIQPFQAFFQWGLPTYSAKSVRFRMGHPRAPLDPKAKPYDSCPDDKFDWTYTSPEFPMSHDNQSQRFELPEPVLCIGGVLMVELLGRVQRQEMDGLFYICVSHVKAMGRTLLPALAAEITEPSGRLELIVRSYGHPDSTPVAEVEVEPLSAEQGRVRDLEQQILNMLRGRGIEIGGYELDEEDDERDYDFLL